MIDLSANNFTQILANSNVIYDGINDLRFDEERVSQFSDWLVQWFDLDPEKYAAELYSTGTQAVEVAVQRALAYSRNREIGKIRNSYHGHSMYLNERCYEFDYTDRPITERHIGDMLGALLLELNPWVYGLWPRSEDNWFKMGMSRIREHVGTETVIIADEISTGLYKTGSKLSSRHQTESKDADIILVGKGIGGPFPVIAMLGKKEILYPRYGVYENYVHNTFGYSRAAQHHVYTMLKSIDKYQNELSGNNDTITDRVNRIEHMVRDVLQNQRVEYANKGVMLALHPGNASAAKMLKEKFKKEGYHVNLYPNDKVIRIQFPLDIPFELLEVRTVHIRNICR